MALQEKCIACRGTEFKKIPYPQNRRRPDLSFESIVICSECRLGLAFPRYDQETLNRFYEAGSFWGEEERSNPHQTAHEKSQSKTRLQALLPFLKKKSGLKVLDIGCGHGFTADWLGKYFGQKTSRFVFVEPDETQAKTVSAKKMPFPIERIDSPACAAEKYDLIFANHVFEHVADPLTFLNTIKGILAEKGIVYIETPHSDYHFKKDVFPHTFFYTPQVLRKLGELAGLKTLKCETFGRYFPRQEGKWKKARNFALAKAFGASVRAGLWPVQRGLDKWIWKYGNRSPGIWLRWIFTLAA